MAEKRKTKTSTEVKTRYNQKTYDVIAVRVPKETAEAFKAKCILKLYIYIITEKQMCSFGRCR